MHSSREARGTALRSVALALTVVALLPVSAQAGSSEAAGASSHSSSHFSVSRSGSTYIAQSQTTTYSGSLKAVVESATSTLNAAGGGTITFQAGTFDLGADYFRLVEISDITFEGQGIDVTVIQNFSTASRDTEPFNFRGAYRVTIRDLTVSAGGSTRNTSDAIDLDKGNDSLVERVKIVASRGKGIIIDGKDAGWTAQGNVIRDCFVSGTTGDGIQLLASSNNRIEGCEVTDVPKDGIRVTKSQTNAAQPNKKSNDNVVTGNVIDNAGENGIRINSSDRNLVSGNRVTNSSDDRSGMDGIRISSGDSVSCDDNVVELNVATDTQSAKTQTYGLNIESSRCNRTFVGSNDFAGNKTGEIRDRGTNTQYGTSDTEAPSTPSGLTAAAVSPVVVEVSWSASNDNVGVHGYTIYRDGSAITSVGGSITSYQDDTVVPGSGYAYTVDAFDAAGNRSAQSAPYAVETPDDTEPPTDPSELAASLNGQGRVDLTWTGSTDNVGVTGYEVFRNGTYLATTGIVTSYPDTSVTPSTTYVYEVRARDAAGNLSGFSNATSVTTPGAPTTLTFPAVEDSYVRQDQPTTNFGNGSTIQVDNSPVKHILLKFDVSGLAGRTVTSAKLRLFAVDPSDLGGVLYRVSDGWSEATVTWDSAPLPTEPSFGSLGSVVSGTWYEIEVPFITADGAYAIRVTSTSSNGADYSSSEGSAPPVLVVTVG